MTLKSTALAATVALGAMTHMAFATDEPIKIGVLHSLSGTMAISETTLKDTMLMLIEEQNKKGGILGRPVEAVVVDPASDWPLFAGSWTILHLRIAPGRTSGRSALPEPAAPISGSQTSRD